jgi:NAD(P)-dependent dehydrogenase (short-subunit alcohol dehydrogenase family)
MADVLVITGASRGIGAATARLAARAGWNVVINYASDVNAARAVARDVESAGRRAVTVHGDVANPADIEAIFAAADALGPVRGFFNNAGHVNTAARVDAYDAERLSRLFAVHVVGAMLCAGAAVRRMSTRHGGSGGAIVNMSSAASKMGAPGLYVDYAAAKGAIDTFTVGLALEVAGEGVRVNAVRPGIIDTEIHAAGGFPDRVAQVGSSLPMGRAGSAEEVAATVLWLLSEEASYVSGASISVGGGRGAVP